MSKPNFFSRGSPYLSHPLLTHQRTRGEVDFLLSRISPPPGACILDVGCGFGRHSIELARRGFNVVGIDPSETMIDAARRSSVGMANPPQFIQQRAEDFHTDLRFDAALCLFTTLGQICGEFDSSPVDYSLVEYNPQKSGLMDNRRLVDRVTALLKPGALFLVEVPHRSWVIDNLKTNERIVTPEGTTSIERSFDPNYSIITETFTVVSPAERRVYLLRYRLFELDELEGILTRSGLLVTDTFAGYTDEPIDETSPAVLMRAVKN